MFDRFIRLARAKKALQEQRLLDALQLASDPLIEADRRAERIREQAVAAIVARVRGRLEAGDLAAAQAEARRLSQLASGEHVDRLVADVGEHAARRRDVEGRQQTTRAEFRRLLDQGELDAVDDLLSGEVDSAAAASLRARVAERRAQALALARAAGAAATPSTLTVALDEFVRAQSIDRNLPERVRADVLAALADAAAKACHEAATLDGRLAAYRAAVGRLPALLQVGPTADLAPRLCEEVAVALQRTGSLADAAALARRARDAELPFDEATERAVTALVACGGGEARGDAAALAQLREAAAEVGWKKLAERAGAALRDVVVGEEPLAEARALLERGELEAARALFVAFLAEQPLHAGVRKELELVDQGLADMDRRLADVRMLLRGGRLREACTGAMALVGSARIAAEAQQILAEARARMALVDRGLDEVRVSLHGRAAATQEGVRHCLKRLEELAKVQVDHAELPAVQAAVEAELDALALVEKASAALARGDGEAVLLALPDLVAARANLLGAERIDAKLCQLGDGVAQFGDRALADGYLSRLQRCAAMLQQLEPVRGDFATRADEWLRAGAARRGEVDALLTKARARLVERDLAEAEALVEEALGRWRESADVHAFGQQLQKLRRQTDALEQVAALTEEKNFLAAQEKLTSMADVPALLRTRVYDMKQGLARAQGLEGAFLLRVDEGGEQLVMRGETVVIGNVRQSRADLPVLANLAGRHASIRRSMSFHGGMQDSVVAEDGEVRVAGEQKARHQLRSGDKVRLGPAMGFVYERPTSRSLTSRIVLQSGFQVAGTDRILLMKDRGRDGRILIGPGRDAHVTVAGATCEVEVFASNTGQMRVACDQGGTIDGAAFKGEHPVAAGQLIEAGGVSFLLLPWRPTA